MLRLPRLGCSMKWFTPPAPLTIPELMRPRCGSPVSGCSILMTSAPQSASTAPAAGTNVHAASSMTRMPLRMSVMSSSAAIRLSDDRVCDGLGSEDLLGGEIEVVDGPTRRRHLQLTVDVQPRCRVERNTAQRDRG